jgi:hypothetical protein
MRRRLSILIAGLALANSAFAQQPADGGKKTTGSVDLGVWSSSLTGSPDLVSEYEPADKTGPWLGFTLDSFGERGSFVLRDEYLDPKNQKHTLLFDVKRVVRSTTSYTRFLARRGHDPMTNLETVGSPKVVGHTDLDPDAVYDHSYGRLEHRTEVQPTQAVTFGVELRDQRRKGAHQGMNISHCATCHVYSQTRPIDESLQDLGVDAKIAWMKGYLKAGYTARRLREDEPAPTLTYERALHPALRTPVFDNRVFYDSRNGPLPVQNRQDADKDKAIGKLVVSDVSGWHFNLGGAWSNTKNLYNALEASYTGGTLFVSKRFRKNVNLRLRGRVYSAKSDDAFFDNPEPATSAGPHVGRTYRDVYGVEVDHERRSSLNRDVIETNAELSVKLGKRGGTLRALWNFSDVDREYYEVAPGETKTTTNLFGAQWRSGFSRELKLSADYRHGSVDNPYMVVDAACSQLPFVQAASPLVPESMQYFTVHDLRNAETTASPESWDDVRLAATFARPNLNLNLSWRYWDGTNTAGDLTDWSRSTNAITATLWNAPSAKWDWYVAYAYQTADMGWHACVPVFDG